jgi:arsenate reductase
VIKSNGKSKRKMIIIYGIKGCDSCKKAIKHFSDRAEFWDIREFPLPRETLKKFVSAFGDSIINTRSQTWRTLTEDDKELNYIDLINTFPTVMKRPVIENYDKISIGWNAEIIKNSSTLEIALVSDLPPKLDT